MQAPKPIRSTDLWSMIPGVVAGAAAYAVVIGAAHWYGYFLIIDSRLVSFMGVQDLVANSVVYMPIAVVAFTASLLLHLTLGGRTLDAPAWVGFVFTRGAHPWRALRDNLILLALFVLTLDNWPLLLPFNALWIFLNVIDILQHYGLYHRHRYVPDFVMGLFFIVTQFLGGVSSAYFMPATANYQLTAAGVGSQVVLIAKTQDYLLVRLATGQVSAVNNADVESLTRILPQPAQRKALLPVFDLFDWLWARVAGLFSYSAAPTPPPPSAPLSAP